MNILHRKYILAATFLIGIATPPLQSVVCADEVRGRILDRSITIEKTSPPSSEADISKLVEASGLQGSDVRMMREATKKVPIAIPPIHIGDA